MRPNLTIFEKNTAVEEIREPSFSLNIGSTTFQIHGRSRGDLLKEN